MFPAFRCFKISGFERTLINFTDITIFLKKKKSPSCLELPHVCAIYLKFNHNLSPAIVIATYGSSPNTDNSLQTFELFETALSLVFICEIPNLEFWDAPSAIPLRL